MNNAQMAACVYTHTHTHTHTHNQALVTAARRVDAPYGMHETGVTPYERIESCETGRGRREDPSADWDFKWKYAYCKWRKNKSHKDLCVRFNWNGKRIYRIPCKIWFTKLFHCSLQQFQRFRNYNAFRGNPYNKKQLLSFLRELPSDAHRGLTPASEVAA